MTKIAFKNLRCYTMRTHDKVLNKNFKDLQKKKSFKVIGDFAKDSSYFKYFPWDTAIRCLEENTIAFVEPSRWNDAYESLYYEADYSQVSTEYETNPRVYATCVSNKKYNEPAWRIYSKEDNICVQFEIDRPKFRLALLEALEDDDSLYEGEVQYLSKYKIDTIWQRKISAKAGALKDNSLYLDFIERKGKPFSIENYFNLLLLKRKDFEHEHETRFFVIKENNLKSKAKKAEEKRYELSDATKREISVLRGDLLILNKMNWSEILKGVVINADESSIQYQQLYNAIKKMIRNNTVDIAKQKDYEKKLKPVSYLVYGTIPKTLKIDK